MKVVFYITNFVLIILAIVLMCLGIIGWKEVITLAVLIVTAIAVGMQAFATRNMAEYQLMPVVDVNMVYENQVRKTYFWFSNTSNTPAFVSFKLFTKKGNNKEQIHNQSLRISPHQRQRTSIAYEFNPSAEKEVVLSVSIKPAFKNFNTKIEFTKSYRFHEFQPGLYRWDETSWGYPDPLWPDKK